MAMIRVLSRATMLKRGMGMRQIRWNSTQPPPQQPQGENGEKVVSPHIGFYKTFTRPIVKVLLMATFTYQVAYWGWVKLEKEEIKRGRNAEIEDLERELRDLTKGKEKGVGP